MPNKKLVLIGGGHTHVLLIRALGVTPIHGVDVVLISENKFTPYSGMLPGYVAGYYSLEQTNIDLEQLCKITNVEWIEKRVEDIDITKQKVVCVNNVKIHFDKLSIDIGSTPDLSVEGASEFALGVKPITGFQTRWNDLLATHDSKQLQGDWGIVGAGAGGVELVLAMAYRLRDFPKLKFHLIYRGESILPGYSRKVVSYAEKALNKFGIEQHPNFLVKKVKREGLESISGQSIKLDQSIWCTGAVGAQWLNNSGVGLTINNFIKVNDYLQSTSHENIFAVGDVAEMINNPRSKAGVYAVRQAPMLERNLRSAFNDMPLEPINLQTQFLSLISLGEKSAIASRNGLIFKGKLIWAVKDWIDQRFIKLFK